MSKFTAMTRRTMSAPMRWLQARGLLSGRGLDYGCGRGFDAKAIGFEGYDPNWAPVELSGVFDTITCNYVLNVVTEEEQSKVLDRIRSLLAPGGKAYVSVRRDLKRDTPGRGCVQRVVKLAEQSLVSNSSFEIYEIR